MKRYIIISCIAALAISLSSCTTIRYVSAERDYNQQWTGQTFANIIGTFGAPDRQVEDGNGGVILIYENFTTSSRTTSDFYYGYHPWMTGPTYNTTVTTDRQYLHFYIGSDYKCYQVRTNYVKEDGREYSPTKTALASVSGALVGLMLIESIVMRANYNNMVAPYR